jgi:hypothetical protein
MKNLNRKQKLALRLAFGALLLTWLFPPWLHYAPKGTYQARGWYFVLDTTQGEREREKYLVYRVDWGRLAVQSMLVLMPGTAGIFALRESEK